MNPAPAARLYFESETMVPRFRVAGDLTLDRFHRDGRVDDGWLGFHWQEFELLWRLAEQPGARVTRKQLLRDVRRIEHEIDTDSLAVHIARVRAKLEPFGLSTILATHPDGGYYLDPPASDIRFLSQQ